MLEMKTVIPEGANFISLGYGETPYYAYLMKSRSYMANGFPDFQYAFNHNLVDNYNYLVVSQSFQTQAVKFLANHSIIATRISTDIYQLHVTTSSAAKS